MSQSRVQSWSRYWQNGALDSLGASLSAGDAGAVQQFWRRIFLPLSSREVVLDVGCGNALLGKLLSECFPEANRCPRYLGIDLATVAPPWCASLSLTQRQRFSLHSREAVEKLPFADQSIDLIISQYGFEYTEFERSIHELRRVWRRGGSMAMVLHHADSLPVRNARIELGHIDFLTARGGLLERAVPMIDRIALLAFPDGRDRLRADPGSAQVRHFYDTALMELDRRVQKEPLPDVLLDARNVVTGLLASAPRTGAASACRMLGQWHEALLDARLRLCELVDCALDFSTLEQLADMLAQGTDSAVFVQPLSLEKDEIYGWILRIQPIGT